MRGGWGPPPRRRPPWWPEGEPFPPARGRGRRRPPPFVRWIGCLFLAALTVAALVGGLVGAFIGGHPLSYLPVIVLGILLVLIVGAAATGGMRRMTRPMDRLIEAAGRIEAGDYSAQVPEHGSSIYVRWYALSTPCRRD
jgi:HAMP domain-containing protein